MEKNAKIRRAAEVITSEEMLKRVESVDERIIFCGNNTKTENINGLDTS